MCVRMWKTQIDKDIEREWEIAERGKAQREREENRRRKQKNREDSLICEAQSQNAK